MGEVRKLDGSVLEVIERAKAFSVPEEEFAAWEAGEARRRREAMLEASGVDSRLDAEGAKAIVEDAMEDTRALQLVKAWLMSSRPALVLLSQPGGGKTVASAWALARIPGRYYRARDLEELMLGDSLRERDMFRSARLGELLVIDELGSERQRGDAADMLQEVIDSRQRLPRRTMLMSNLTPTELLSRYDARTLDRLGINGDDDGIAILRSLPVTHSLRARSRR